MSPAPSGSLALQRVKLGDALEIRDKIMLAGTAAMDILCQATCKGRVLNSLSSLIHCCIAVNAMSQQNYVPEDSH